MSQFEYFFGFYSIVLGLSVVELLAGVARVIDDRRTVKVDRLTLLLAAFVALDLSSYWLQAWMLYRGAPLSMGILTHGLAAAGAYYIAAYLVFPRGSRPRRAQGSEEHFWSVRRWVFGLILVTNILNVGTLVILGGGLRTIGAPAYVAFIVTFYIACAVAAFAPRGRAVVWALIWLLMFSVLAMALEAVGLAQAGAWTLRPPGGEA